jgi:hypothetical protein
MENITVERGLMYVSNVAKLSFGLETFKDINEIAVEKISGSVSSVGKPCLLLESSKTPTNPHWRKTL